MAQTPKDHKHDWIFGHNDEGAMWAKCRDSDCNLVMGEGQIQDALNEWEEVKETHKVSSVIATRHIGKIGGLNEESTT